MPSLAHNPVIWWVAICALCAAGVWCAHEARRSWLARQAKRDLRHNLDLVRFSLLALASLGIAVIEFAHRLTGRGHSLRILGPFALVLGSLYVTMLALQIKLGHGTRHRKHQRQN